MDTSIQNGAKATPSKNSLVVKVRYLAVGRPFVEPKADSNESLASLKPRVLGFFELAEGTANGGTKVYQFVHGSEVLTDLSVTLGSIAEGKKEVDLMLIEQFEQG